MAPPVKESLASRILAVFQRGDVSIPDHRPRNRALIALLYRAGLRINEALTLYPKDLELADGSVRVLHGKGGRSRTVGLDPGAAAIIERWLDARSRLGLGSCHPVFCTLREHPMTADYVRVMLKRLAARAGIEKRVHARCSIRLRHQSHKVPRLLDTSGKFG